MQFYCHGRRVFKEYFILIILIGLSVILFSVNSDAISLHSTLSIMNPSPEITQLMIDSNCTNNPVSNNTFSYDSNRVICIRSIVHDNNSVEEIYSQGYVRFKILLIDNGTEHNWSRFGNNFSLVGNFFMNGTNLIYIANFTMLYSDDERTGEENDILSYRIKAAVSDGYTITYSDENKTNEIIDFHYIGPHNYYYEDNATLYKNEIFRTNSSDNISSEIIALPTNNSTNMAIHMIFSNNSLYRKPSNYTSLDRFIEFHTNFSWWNMTAYTKLNIFYQNSDNISDENKITILFYNNTTDEWELLSQYGLNKEGHYAWGDIVSDGVYGLFENTSSESTDSEIAPIPVGGGGSCKPHLKCSSWGACVDGKKRKICFDRHNCIRKPLIKYKDCKKETNVCKERWVCDKWSECIHGKQTRVCIDKNNCNLEKNKPKDKISCKVKEKAQKNGKDNNPINKLTNDLKKNTNKNKRNNKKSDVVPLGTSLIISAIFFAIVISVIFIGKKRASIHKRRSKNLRVKDKRNI